MSRPTIGLVAGSGVYPVQLSRRLVKNGYQVVVAGVKGDAVASNYSALPFMSFYIGQIRATCSWFKKWGIGEILMAGGIRPHLFKRNIRPDLSILPRLPSLLRRGDDWRLRCISDIFNRKGLSVISPRPWIGDWFPASGHIAGPFPGKQQEQLIARGKLKCAEFVTQDIGQAVVVHGPHWYCLEDCRGTNHLMTQVPGPGAILVKMKKRNQDTRFDIPAIGPETIRTAFRVGITGIAVEAETVMVLAQDQVHQLCAELNITLVAF